MEEKDRKLLQNIGAKMREIDPHIIIQVYCKRCFSAGRLPLIVDGIRTLTEAEPFKESIQNFVIIRKSKNEESQRLDAYKKEYNRYPTPEELTT